jgi:hypothetical protein
LSPKKTHYASFGELRTHINTPDARMLPVSFKNDNLQT